MPEPEYITPRELYPFQRELAALTERFNGVEERLDKMMANDLAHVHGDLDKLREVVSELKESVVPFVKGVNDTVRALQQTVAQHGESIQRQRFELWKVGWKLGLVFSVGAFLANSYGSRLAALLAKL